MRVRLFGNYAELIIALCDSLKICHTYCVHLGLLGKPAETKAAAFRSCPCRLFCCRLYLLLADRTSETARTCTENRKKAVVIIV